MIAASQVAADGSRGVAANAVGDKPLALLGDLERTADLPAECNLGLRGGCQFVLSQRVLRFLPCHLLGPIHSRLAEQLRFPVYSDKSAWEGDAIRTPSPHPRSHFQCDAACEFQLSLDKNAVTKYLSTKQRTFAERKRGFVRPLLFCGIALASCSGHALSELTALEVFLDL